MRDIRMLKSAPALVTVLALLGCGDGGAPEPQEQQQQPGQAQTASEPAATPSGTITPAMQAFSDDGNVIEIEIEGDDQIRFNINRFTVGAGQMVRLTLRHVGVLPAAALGHNVVILKLGEDFFEFGADAGEQGGSLANDYVPESLRDRVVAFTALIGGGESATVEFQAPSEPGEYPFLCSFPGHFAQMNGVMEVQAQ